MLDWDLFSLDVAERKGFVGATVEAERSAA
jgi:hypothetical protein